MADGDQGGQQGGQQQQGADGGGQQQQTAWHTGIDGELLGVAQNKGWKLDDPKVAFSSAATAYREAQRLVGAPPELMLRLPKDQADEAGWKQVYTRLGVPDDAKGYDFSGVKFSDGTEIDAAFADSMRAALHGANVSKDRASDVVRAVVKFMDSADAEENAVKASKLTEEKAELAKNWGANEAANKFIAQQAATKLGIAPETVAALEGVVGYKAIMEMFHKIGTAIGEAKFVASEGNQSGVMTRDQAQAKKTELMADKAWRDRYIGGGAAERREMHALNVLITGVAA